jgi:kynurenine formamidase
MRLKTFIIACALAVALFVFAQRRPDIAKRAITRNVVDLTHSINPQTPTFEGGDKPAFHAHPVASLEKDGYFAQEISIPEHFGTHLDAPAHFFAGTWTVDQIPPQRLVAPLIVLDVSAQAKDHPDYQVSIDDVAAWERTHGSIPLGCVVMAYTGWSSRWNNPESYRNADAKGVMHFPGYSEDAAKFLVDARQIVGLGIDTLSIDYGPSPNFPVHRYVLAQGVYQLENVADLNLVPPTGAQVIVAPLKIEGGSGAPVRILALTP